MLSLPLVLALVPSPVIDSTSLTPDAPIQESRTTHSAPASLTQSGFQYSFVEVELGLVNLDDVSDDLYTFGINGSYSVAEQVFLFGSYQAGYADISGAGNLDTDTFQLGVGYHAPLSDSTDFVGKLSYVDVEADLDGASDSENGWDLEAGLRYWATDQIELDGSLEIEDVDSSETGVNLGARYYFSPPVSAGLDFAFFSDSNAGFINLRYAF